MENKNLLNLLHRGKTLPAKLKLFERYSSLAIIFYTIISYYNWDFPKPNNHIISEPGSLVMVSMLIFFLPFTILVSRLQINLMRWAYVLYLLHEFSNIFHENILNVSFTQLLGYSLLLIPYFLFFKAVTLLFSKDVDQWFAN